LRIGIIGCGFIGTTIGAALDQFEEVEEVNLLDVSYEASVRLAASLRKARLFAVEDFQHFLSSSDLIVEAASQEAVAQYGARILASGADLMLMSVGALVDDNLWKTLSDTARNRGTRIFVPSGAISGLDGLGAASNADIESISLTVRKPPQGLSLPSQLKHLSGKLMGLNEPLVLFEGTAREAVQLFPKNVNVAAAIAISGVGFDRTTVKVIADPTVTRNRHLIEARGRFGEMRVEMLNSPSTTNPRTSYLAPLSAVAMIRKIISGIFIGS